MTEPWPKSGKLSNMSSDARRTSPTVLKPAADSTFWMRVDNWTRLTRVVRQLKGWIEHRNVHRSLFCALRLQYSISSSTDKLHQFDTAAA
jgi:hypothetical protein